MPSPTVITLLLLSSLPQALATPNPNPIPIQTITTTILPPSASTAPSFLSTKLFTSTILNTTNTYRVQHSSPPLKWNTTLAKYAFAHAASTSCIMKHSTSSSYGENLAIGCSEVQGCVELWGDERKGYDFENGEFSMETGHFTQLVWKETTEVGCGAEWCGDEEGRWYLVCEYWPRGNVIGEFKGEVERGVFEGTAGRGKGIGGWGWLVVIAAMAMHTR